MKRTFLTWENCLYHKHQSLIVLSRQSCFKLPFYIFLNFIIKSFPYRDFVENEFDSRWKFLSDVGKIVCILKPDCSHFKMDETEVFLTSSSTGTWGLLSFLWDKLIRVICFWMRLHLWLLESTIASYWNCVWKKNIVIILIYLTCLYCKYIMYVSIPFFQFSYFSRSSKDSWPFLTSVLPPVT